MNLSGERVRTEARWLWVRPVLGGARSGSLHRWRYGGEGEHRYPVPSRETRWNKRAKVCKQMRWGFREAVDVSGGRERKERGEAR